MKRHVRHVLKDENPTIWVGKEGITTQLIGENTAQAIAVKVSEQTNSGLVEVRGHVLILFRKRKSAEPDEIESEKK